MTPSPVIVRSGSLNHDRPPKPEYVCLIVTVTGPGEAEPVAQPLALGVTSLLATPAG